MIASVLFGGSQRTMARPASERPCVVEGSVEDWTVAKEQGFPLYILVANGVDAGARLFPDDLVRVIGRAREADLPLSDRSVSRRHLEVVVSGGRLHVSARDGASAFMLRGRT